MNSINKAKCIKSLDKLIYKFVLVSPFALITLLFVGHLDYVRDAVMILGISIALLLFILD
jgi:hypothetical protein